MKSKYKTLEELPEKAVITIPGDPVNGGRAWRTLSDSGLIKLKDGVGEQGAQRDIIENKKDFKIVEVDTTMLPNAYAGVTPAEVLIIDDYQDAHTMVLVAREDNKNEEAIKKVAAEFESTELQHLLVD